MSRALQFPRTISFLQGCLLMAILLSFIILLISLSIRLLYKSTRMKFDSLVDLEMTESEVDDFFDEVEEYRSDFDIGVQSGEEVRDGKLPGDLDEFGCCRDGEHGDSDGEGRATG